MSWNNVSLALKLFFQGEPVKVGGLDQLPTLAILAADQRLDLGRVLRAEVLEVPLEFLTRPERDVAEVIRFGQPARVFEVASSGRAGLTGVNPLGVMAERLRDERFGPFEVRELGFRQQSVFAVIGKQHALVADEQNSAFPLRDPGFFQDLRLIRPLVPAEPHWRHRSTLTVLVRDHHRRGRDLGVRRGAGGFDRQRAIELERPEWEVHPMASEVRHRAVAEVPPAIPFRPGQIDFIERALRRGAQPQVPIQTGGYGRAVRRAVLDEDYVAGRLRLFFAGMQAPGAADPYVRFGDCPDRPALD